MHRILGQTRRSLCKVFAQGTTTNSVVYCETLKKLRRAIQNERRGMLSATILLLHDNARTHSAAQTQDLIISFKWEQIDHAPYSHDLAPSDYHLFLHLTLILRRSHTGTVWFYTSTSNKRAGRPKLYTESLTGDLNLMYSRLTLVRISINL